MKNYNLISNKKILLTIALAVFLFIFTLGFLLAPAGKAYADIYEDMHEYATEGDVEELAFEIDTGGYTAGNAISMEPTFTLTLTGSAQRPEVTDFYFIEQDSISEPGINEQWKLLTKDTTGDNFAVYVPSMGNNPYFHKHVYFKTIIKKQESGNPTLSYEYLKNEVPIEIIVDKSTEFDYAITGISARYKGAGGVFVPYDCSSNAIFVSTEIRFDLQTGSEETTSTTYQYYYDGCGVANINQEWVSIEGKSIIFTADNAGQINGPIYFRAKRADGTTLQYNESQIFAYLDTVSPTFRVKGVKAISRTDYVLASWSSENVEYTITPQSTNISEVRYFYRTTGGYTEILPDEYSNYKITIENTTSTLKFEARTSAGMTNNLNDSNHNTLIDKHNPLIYITAKDKDGTTIAPVGSQDGQGFRVGYASGKISFVIENKDAQGTVIPNTSTVTYQYSIDGGKLNPIPLSGGKYSFEKEAAEGNFYNMVFTFVLTSGAGLSDTKTFEVNILKSDFEVILEEPEFNTHNGWISENVLLNFLIADGDYKFYNQVAGEFNSMQELTDVTKGAIVNGKRRFEVVFSRPVTNASIIFRVENMAGDIVDKQLTQAINFDNALPDANISGVVLGSQQPIRSGEWSNGKVVLNVSPYQNLSGVSVAYVYSNGVEEPMIKNQEGVYSVIIQKTTTCVFRLTSGSGLQRDVVFQVNIDLSDIDIEIKNHDDIAGHVHSQDVPIAFITTHTGDYTVWYKELGVNADFIQTQSRTFTVPISNEIAQGVKQFVFFLEARAIDKNGNRKRSAEISIAIQYNRTPSNIEVRKNYDQGVTIQGDWSNGAIIFDITYLFGHTYQASLSGGEWKNISTNQDGDLVYFGFAGVANGNIVYNKNDQGHFNGSVAIRAINNAGYPSNVIVFDNIKVDNSQPKTINAISIQRGEKDSANKHIYSADDIILRNTDGLAEFSQYAPIIYYIHPNQEGEVAAPVEGNMGSWEVLTVDRVYDQNETLLLYARNILQASSGDVEKYEFIVNKGDINFNVSFPLDAGSKKEANIFEYTWSTSAANVEFYSSSGSEINMYYYYTTYSGTNVPEDQWILINPGSSEPGSFTFTYEDNINATFQFRVKNRAGTIVVSPNKAVIRIDKVEPTFIVEYTAGGAPYTSGSWSSEAIIIKVTPTSTNPGGVDYEYYFDGVWTKTPSLNLTTDMIENFGFDLNGKGTFQISATSLVNSQRYISPPIEIKVDKSMPKFELQGKKSNDISIASGEWCNEEQIRIDITKQHNNLSDVIYYYEKDNEGSIEVPDYIRVETSCVVTVTAISEAGLRTVKTFVVNIDTIPPRIDAGKIVNPAPGADANEYYVDQVIYYTEENVKRAEYNGYALINGMEISTKNVETHNEGFVHIVIEDLAGNVAELVFFMKPFPRDINNITLSAEDKALVDAFEEELNAAISLSSSRRAYFANQISRLRDRMIILQGQVDDFHRYLEIVNAKNTFELNSDYDIMESYITRFYKYATWQQLYILESTIKPYDIYFAKLEEKFSVLDKVMTKVRQVETQIADLPAINVVEKSDYINIKAVYNAYESLTLAQKGKLKSTLRAKLIEVYRLCQLMMLQDEATGVSLYGDDLAGGLEIEVTPFAKSTKKFIDAQQTLLDSFISGQPRAIASIHQISLTGESTSTITGDIEITIPIPDDFTNYISFAVYRLNNDGTVVKVQNAEVSADGRSITFGSTDLGTYMVAANANIERIIEDTTFYGMIGNIVVDTQMLTYISIAVGILFGLTILILVLSALKRRAFLKKFNKSYKHSLVRRGIESIPKGNPAPRSNPSSPNERLTYKRKAILR